jgi:hypothetical protein
MQQQPQTPQINPEYQKHFKPSPEIIWQSAQREMPGQDQNKFFAGLAKLLQNPRNKLLQVRNTVFLIMGNGPGVVEFHTFSVSGPKELLADAKEAIQIVKKAGAKKLISYSPDARFNQLIQATGLPWKISQSQMTIGNKAVPAYRYELDL